MTEQQFTPEYIEYILSDEAKGLQKQKPILEWGDVVYASPSGAIGLVRKQPSYPGGFYEIAVPHGDVVLALDRQRWELTWLPTLWQLLRIIEGRWPNIQVRIGPGPWIPMFIRAWGESVRDEPESDGLHWCNECRKKEPCPHQAWAEDKDLLLAAAQLAVRAVEGET